MAELDDKIYELRRIIQDKELTIQELEKMKPIVESDGVLIKYREVYKIILFFKKKFIVVF